MSSQKIKFSKTPEATALGKGPGNPAGLDLYASTEVKINGRNSAKVPTGIKLKMPKGIYATIEERSGVSIRTPLSKKAGIIDSDYRGEIIVVLQNISDFPFTVSKGDPIAQLIFHKQLDIVVEEIETVNAEETERGEKGFGSSDS